MRRLYTFSPITSKEQFEEALAYIVQQAGELSEKLTGTKLKLKNAKVFAHYPEEFEFMKKLIANYGELSDIGRSTSVYVNTDVDIEGSHLSNIGIRIPDPYRAQVGCGDYEVSDLHAFLASLPTNKQDYVRPFPDLPEQFVELWHPDYDVAGYIVLK